MATGSAQRVPLHGGVEPQLAHHIDGIPAAGSCAGGCWYEPKWDGFRALAYLDANRGVMLESRRRKSMKGAFPDIMAAVYERLPARTVLDGEIVRWAADGRLDFEALQRRNVNRRGDIARLVRDEPCHYIVFDVLVLAGEQLADRPFTDRRAALEDLFGLVPGTSPLALGLATPVRDTAVEWFDRLAAVGVEGIMVKPGRDRYRPGNRSAWGKVKRFTTTEAIVGGVTGTLRAPRDVILGRYFADTGELVVAGRTTPLKPAAARTLGAMLTPAGEEHPWPALLPPGWAGRTPQEYIRVRPEVVVEIRTEVAATETRWRHGLRYLRPRPDLDPANVPAGLDIETAQ